MTSVNTKQEYRKQSGTIDYKMAGAVLCETLIRIYTLHSLKIEENIPKTRKSTVVSALSCLLCISQEAKNWALNEGFLELLIDQLKELHAKLSLESLGCVRNNTNQKRVS